MNFIFADNYRGFSNALIPITDVNFLVGENSTGKSSILSLIGMLGQYMLSNELNIREAGFATFGDVVSIGSRDKSYVAIGSLTDTRIRRQEKRRSASARSPGSSVTACVVSFREKEGMPVAESFIYYRDGLEIRARFTDRTIRYKARKFEIRGPAAQFASAGFIEWAASLRSDTTGFVRLDTPVPTKRLPLMFVVQMIESKLRSSVEEWGFEFPAGFISNVAWLAPIRSKPRKTYDEFSLEYSPEGEHTPYVIKKILDSKSDKSRFQSFLNEVGNDSGLFKEVKIKRYGRTKTSPFELDVVLNREAISVSNVGYGVSQALPVIVEMFYRQKGAWLAIQQPEVHLHPRAQAAMGSAVLGLAVHERKKFLIETHSDYMVDRFRLALGKVSSKISAQVLFFERNVQGNFATPIPIMEDGGLSDSQPDSYRAFFLKEEMNILGLD